MKNYNADDVGPLLKERIKLDELESMEGEKVSVAGFVEKMKDFGDSLKFIELSDSSGKTQLTLAEEIYDEVTDTDDVRKHTFLTARGKVVDGQWDKGNEIHVEELYKLGEEAEELPISTGKRSGIDKRMNNRWVDLKDEKSYLPVKATSKFVKYAREYFYEKGLMELFSPKLMSSQSESGSELFSVDYFERQAHLAQSPQFYKQMAMAAGFESVFEIAPVFRANPSYTSRHDTEFTSLDVELSYITSHTDVMDFQEDMLNYAFNKLDEEMGDRLEDIYGQSIKAPGKIPRVEIEEIYSILDNKGFKSNGDLTTPGEKRLGEIYKEEYGSDFVFVENYPYDARPFYHMLGEEMDDGRITTRSYDLIYRGLEITTGAQREHRYSKLVEQAEENGVKPGELGSYTDFFKYGCPPHGGFGMSPTRLMKAALDLDNVKEATFSPRDPNRLEP